MASVVKTTVRLAAISCFAVAIAAGCSSDHHRSVAPSSSVIEQQRSSDAAASTFEMLAATVDSRLDKPTALPGLLGAAARAATSSRSDAPNLAGHIQIADVLIKPTASWDLLVDAPSVPLSERERAGIEAEYSPVPILFVDLSSDGPMLLL
ncbi:MAG: hypothetical protein JWR83_587, partial [Aeromicrobium sp.]|nr:hypothetical protein [Aeromicrobium sp.]